MRQILPGPFSHILLHTGVLLSSLFTDCETEAQTGEATCQGPEGGKRESKDVRGTRTFPTKMAQMLACHLDWSMDGRPRLAERGRGHETAAGALDAGNQPRAKFLGYDWNTGQVSLGEVCACS